MKIDETTTAAAIETYHARTRELEAAVSYAATCHVNYRSVGNQTRLIAAIADLNRHMGIKS